MPTSIVRKSGNSTILVLPPELVKERNIKIGENVEFQIFKKVDLSHIFGKGRHLKIDSQKAKNMLREEW